MGEVWEQESATVRRQKECVDRIEGNESERNEK